MVPVQHPQAQTVQNPSTGTVFRRSLAGVLNVIVAVVAIVVGLGYLIAVALLGGFARLVVRTVRRRRFAAAP